MCLAESQPLAIQGFVGTLESGQRLGRKAAPPQAFDIDAVRCSRLARGHDVRRNILEYHAGNTRHDVGANFAELVHAGKPTQDGIVTHRHMSRQGSVIGENRMVAHLAVMGEMDIGHDPVVVADTRHARILRSAQIESAEFAYGIAVANFQPGRLSRIFLVLRNFSQGVELENMIIAADKGMPVNNRMRAHRGAVADDHVLADHGVGTDTDMGAKLRAGMNDCAGVNHLFQRSVAIISASATRWPSTSA